MREYTDAQMESAMLDRFERANGYDYFDPLDVEENETCEICGDEIEPGEHYCEECKDKIIDALQDMEKIAGDPETLWNAIDRLWEEVFPPQGVM